MRLTDECCFCRRFINERNICGVGNNIYSVYPCKDKDTDKEKELEDMIHKGTV